MSERGKGILIGVLGASIFWLLVLSLIGNRLTEALMGFAGH